MWNFNINLNSNSNSVGTLWSDPGLWNYLLWLRTRKFQFKSSIVWLEAWGQRTHWVPFGVTPGNFNLFYFPTSVKNLTVAWRSPRCNKYHMASSTLKHPETMAPKALHPSEQFHPFPFGRCHWFNNVLHNANLQKRNFRRQSPTETLQKCPFPLQIQTGGKILGH